MMNSDSAQPLSEENPNFSHIPVLAREVIEGLAVRPGGHYLDATVGGGGHSSFILEAMPDISLTAIDQDEEALAAAEKRLALYGDRIKFVYSNFANYQFPANAYDGILADLGVSSHHLDSAERGFSFRHTASLDMRMDKGQSLTAAEVINDWDEVELADIFFKYGEERLSRRIARRIVEKRPFNTTTELASEIAYSVPRKYRYGRIHPATRVFQALRIVVNDELNALETLLAKAPESLVSGGRIAIISFHSLEDRLVKNAFRNSPILKIVTKKPIQAQQDEIINNPRARSAKLRVAERLENEE
jgi:16S rRNA (cytosine1402-N4)-methyltransferase